MEKFHQETNTLKSVFKSNGYRKNFIDSCIKNFLDNLFVKNKASLTVPNLHRVSKGKIPTIQLTVFYRNLILWIICMPNNQNFSKKFSWFSFFWVKIAKKSQYGSRMCYPSVSFLKTPDRKLRSEQRTEEMFFLYLYVLPEYLLPV